MTKYEIRQYANKTYAYGVVMIEDSNVTRIGWFKNKMEAEKYLNNLHK